MIFGYRLASGQENYESPTGNEAKQCFRPITFVIEDFNVLSGDFDQLLPKKLTQNQGSLHLSLSLNYFSRFSFLTATHCIFSLIILSLQNTDLVCTSVPDFIELDFE